MALPFRDNPKIITNWFHTKTKNVMPNKKKLAYYDISATEKPGWIVIRLREEKKRLGGSQEREEFWFGSLEFEVDSTFAKDLKMFLNQEVKGEAPEVAQAKKERGEEL